MCIGKTYPASDILLVVSSLDDPLLGHILLLLLVTADFQLDIVTVLRNTRDAYMRRKDYVFINSFHE